MNELHKKKHNSFVEIFLLECSKMTFLLSRTCEKKVQKKKQKTKKTNCQGILFWKLASGVSWPLILHLKKIVPFKGIWVPTTSWWCVVLLRGHLLLVGPGGDEAGRSGLQGRLLEHGSGHHVPAEPQQNRHQEAGRHLRYDGIGNNHWRQVIKKKKDQLIHYDL